MTLNLIGMDSAKTVDVQEVRLQNASHDSVQFTGALGGVFLRSFVNKCMGQNRSLPFNTERGDVPIDAKL